MKNNKTLRSYTQSANKSLRNVFNVKNNAIFSNNI